MIIYKNTKINAITKIDEIPSRYQITSCEQLSITADNVAADVTTTTIHFTANCTGIDNNTNDVLNMTITGDSTSEDFGVNSQTTPREVTVNYTFFNQTASAIITQEAGSAPSELYNITFDSEEKVATWSAEGPLSSYDFLSFVNRYDGIPCLQAQVITEVNDKSFIISPLITLGSDNYNVEFENTAFYFDTEEDVQKVIKFIIREEGGQWEEIPNAKYSINWKEFVSSSLLPIPTKFNNKNIQVGFSVYDTLGVYPTLQLKNLKISIQ